MNGKTDNRDASLSAPEASKVGWTDLDVRAVDTVRVLAADAVQRTGNGHPGTAMSLAPAAYLLYQKIMKHDPSQPHWPGRDRFVLSAGHTSLTQYIQLYLSGYGLELDDLKALRTWGSKTPGHPEVGHTTGVEITTGPLGSGLASAVGMAMAVRRIHGMLDPDTPLGESIFDHHVYTIASDGDMMEGVASEASSLAGHQELGNLTILYDKNQISIEDDTDVSFSEDVGKRYEAYGFHVQTVDWRTDKGYVEDVDALDAAFAQAKAETGRPSLIILDTIIAWPAPNAQNTGKSHGAALGEEEVAATKRLLGFDPEKTFEVGEEVLEHTRQVIERGQKARADWEKRYADWANANPEADRLLQRLRAGELPEGLAEAIPEFPADDKGMATRAASGKILTALADVMPELWGGSADLAESNNTTMGGQPSFVPESKQTDMWPGNPYGRTLHFGIRENAMGMILNGISLHGLTRPYGGTFLIFSDYMRPAVRLAAIQEGASTFVWTHDSVGLGEDGPTHQPIEHLAALRAMPGIDIVRPADANETGQAWLAILRNRKTAGLCLSRQGLPTLDRSVYGSVIGVAKGAYVLKPESQGQAQVILIATGSEVSLALKAAEQLEAEGIATRLVSMPCREWFEAQDHSYRDEVIPPTIRARVSVEAASPLGWRDYVGDAGRIVGIDHFGASADGATLFREFGFTPENVVSAAKESIEAANAQGGN